VAVAANQFVDLVGFIADSPGGEGDAELHINLRSIGLDTLDAALHHHQVLHGLDDVSSDANDVVQEL
jgi:hypothetical protein